MEAKKKEYNTLVKYVQYVSPDMFLDEFGESFNNYKNKYAESVIESTITIACYKCSKAKVIKRATPKYLGKGGETDGVIEYIYYKGEVLGHGVNETKKVGNSKPLTVLPKQLIQCLHAIFLFNTVDKRFNFQVVTLTSEKYSSYVFLSEIQPLIDRLNEKFKLGGLTPSQSSIKADFINIVKEYDINYNIRYINTEYELHKEHIDILGHIRSQNKMNNFKINLNK